MKPTHSPSRRLNFWILPAIALVLLFSPGCRTNVVFESHQDLSADYEWEKADQRTFVIPINDNKYPYQFDLVFRCASGYAYDVALIRITETDPAGRTTVQDVEVKVRNEDGTFCGDKGFDLIDLTTTLNANKTFPVHGDYVYTITQNMPDIDPLNYALQVGLVLRRTS